MKKFFLSIIIFVGILCVGNIVATSNFSNDLNFEFNDVSYNLNLEELESKNDISLEDYPYYFVGDVIEKNSSHLALFYSKERISVEEKETDETDTTTCYYVCGGEETLEFVIETDGSIQEGKMVDLKKSSIVIADTGFIASNQDIYCNADSILVFSNSKDEYNEKENAEIYDKIVEKVDEEISDIEINSDIVSSENTEIIEENTKKIEFSYKGKTYTVDLAASDLGINLDEYEYYFVTGDGLSRFTLYYSKERMRINYAYSGRYEVKGGEETLSIAIGSDGSVGECNIVDLKDKYVTINNNFVASNQNIYYDGKLIFIKNSGYEYDKTQEKGEECNEIVKTTDAINVYEKAAVNYDIVATMAKGSAVKRVKKGVNERNGHTWDKVILSNGKEGYVFTDGLEIAEDTEKISFKYNDVTYTTYLSSTGLGVNLDEYEYYFVMGNGTSNFGLYYSRERIWASYAYSGRYEVKGGEETLQIAIGLDGSVGECNIVDLKDKYVTINNNYVASNQNIYYDGKLIFIKNSGYEYDKTQEKGEECNEIVKTTNAINVYEKAAVNYDIIATMASGSAIKRVKKGVNERNGHTWDKVILSNGKEGYVFTDELEIAEDTKEISFKYNDVTYTTYLSSTGLEVNLDEYEYYFVTGDGTSNFLLYYSKERVWARYGYSNWHEIKGGEETLQIAIGLDGSVGECNIIDLKNKDVTVTNSKFVASNQNIYYGNNKIFNRNSGYEYDEAKEEGEECNEIVKTTDAIKVYEKAAVNYDIIATMAKGSAVKRVKKGVNERNGHTWDKVILSNGKEGYVFTDELEIAKDTKEISFKYKDAIYTIYLSSTGLGVNLDEYKYYFVAKSGTSNFVLYYSKEKVWARYGYSNWHEIKGGEETLQIAIGLDGSVGECNIIDLKNGDVTIINSNFVASNQDIYYNNTIVFKMREYVENGSLAYVTNTSLQDVAYEPNAYEGIIKGEKEYNAMSEAEHLERDFILSEEKLGLSAAANTATALLGLPNAGEALEYYLTKGTFGWSYNHYSYEITPFCTDHTRREISLYSGLEESSYMRNALVEQINATMELGEKLCIEEGQEVKFSNALEKREEVKDVRDWHYTLGKYRVRVESVVKKIGNSYQLNMKYYIEDYYDWDPTTDRKGFLDEFVPMLYELNYAGMARNYTNYGEIEYSSTWEKGQRRSEDDITKLINGRK